MAFQRAAGVLLHPTSLPGPRGIGEMGDEVARFLDFLVAAGQRWWQVLPVVPTGYGNSPYSGRSAFAGNPLLLDMTALVELGLLEPGELADPDLASDHVDFERVGAWKRQRFEAAHGRLAAGAAPEVREQVAAFGQAHDWAADYALYMALKERHEGASWDQWDAELRRREPSALAAARRELGERIGYHLLLQWLFDQQWSGLKQRVNERGIGLIGDIPLFVAYDSADVWAHPELFQIEESGRPVAVAGVPPDYFSATGQLWGNPLYDWEYAQQSGFAWWTERFRRTFAQVDAVRVDHFRGLEAYWRVPYGESTAVNGEWVKAPGEALFEHLRGELGELPIIAEDLGIITPEVDALRERFGFPGMKILQFAFVEEESHYLPHRYETNSVVYTGTHDNDTTVGWWHHCRPDERERLIRYLGGEPVEVNWALIHLALHSPADTALFPLQDVLGLGAEARMNTPGMATGNWGWRLGADADLDRGARQLREMTAASGRLHEA